MPVHKFSVSNLPTPALGTATAAAAYREEATLCDMIQQQGEPGAKISDLAGVVCREKFEDIWEECVDRLGRPLVC